MRSVAVLAVIAVGAIVASATGGDVKVVTALAVHSDGNSCPQSCLPKLCTDDATIAGEPTHLTYLCPESADLETVTTTVTKTTTVTPILTATAGEESGACSATEAPNEIPKVTLVTPVTGTVKEVSSKVSSSSVPASSPVDENTDEPTTTITLHSKITVTKTITVSRKRPSESSVSSSVTDVSSGVVSITSTVPLSGIISSNVLSTTQANSDVVSFTATVPLSGIISSNVLSTTQASSDVVSITATEPLSGIISSNAFSTSMQVSSIGFNHTMLLSSANSTSSVSPTSITEGTIVSTKLENSTIGTSKGSASVTRYRTSIIYVSPSPHALSVPHSSMTGTVTGTGIGTTASSAPYAHLSDNGTYVAISHSPTPVTVNARETPEESEIFPGDVTFVPGKKNGDARSNGVPMVALFVCLMVASFVI